MPNSNPPPPRLPGRRHFHSDTRLVVTIVILVSIIAVNVTGVLGDIPAHSATFWCGQLYAMSAAVLLWFFILDINRRLRLYRHWIRRPVTSNFLPGCFNVALAVMGAAGAYWLWTAIAGTAFRHEIAFNLGLCVLAISSVWSFTYRLSFLNVMRISAGRRLKSVEKVAHGAQISALKSQLDPHFLLNSLNVLCHLVESSPRDGAKFAENLSWIYQYVLRIGQHDLVPLSDELEFVERYCDLLKLRFGNAISLRIDHQEVDLKKSLIPPLALQTLLENAVKHNTHSNEKPLTLTIDIDHLRVRAINSINPFKQPIRDGGVGLSNLSNRIFLLTGLNLHIERSLDTFSVAVPIVHGETS